MISAEKYYPYMRPPLSKDIWYTDNDELLEKHWFKQWNGQERRFFHKRFQFLSTDLFSIVYISWMKNSMPMLKH